MRNPSFRCLAGVVVLTLACLACSDSNEVTGSSRPAVSLSVHAPEVVRAGEEFQLRLELQSLGANIRNARVDVVLPSVSFSLAEESTISSSLFVKALHFSSGGFAWAVADFGPNGRPFVSLPFVGHLPTGQGATPTTVEATLIGATYGGEDVHAVRVITVTP